MSTARSKRLALASAMAAGLLLVSGCTGGDSVDDSGDQSSQAEPTAADATPEPNTVNVTRTTSLGPEIVESGETKSKNENNITVGFAGLKVDGKLATLTLTYTPEFSGVDDSKPISLFSMFGNHTIEPNLVDVENLKRYTVATASDGGELGPDSVNTKTLNHQPVAVAYTFAAPAIDVVDIYLADKVIFSRAKVER